MNIFRTIFCRTFQAAFRLALPLLPYREPEKLTGVKDIALLLTEKHIHCAMLVTDKWLHDSGATKPLEEALAGAGIKCAVYDGTRANPTRAMPFRSPTARANAWPRQRAMSSAE